MRKIITTIVLLSAVIALCTAQFSNSGDIVGLRFVSKGASPTCSVTGAGTGATCTIDSIRSNDNWGIAVINTGTTPGASGTLTLTYSSNFANGSSCTWSLQNVASSWNARATIISQGGAGASGDVVNWDNNAVNLTGSQASAYAARFSCGGR